MGRILIPDSEKKSGGLLNRVHYKNKWIRRGKYLRLEAAITKKS
jgi:hypothetical protein